MKNNLRTIILNDSKTTYDSSEKFLNIINIFLKDDKINDIANFVDSYIDENMIGTLSLKVNSTDLKYFCFLGILGYLKNNQSNYINEMNIIKGKLVDILNKLNKKE